MPRSTERLPTVGRAAQIPAAVGRLWSLRGFFWQDKRNLSEWVCRAFVPASHLARLRAMPPAAWPATRSVAHGREGKKYAAGRYARRRGARDGT